MTLAFAKRCIEKCRGSEIIENFNQKIIEQFVNKISTLITATLHNWRGQKRRNPASHSHQAASSCFCKSATQTGVGKPAQHIYTKSQFSRLIQIAQLAKRHNAHTHTNPHTLVLHNMLWTFNFIILLAVAWLRRFLHMLSISACEWSLSRENSRLRVMLHSGENSLRKETKSQLKTGMCNYGERVSN